jgi:hypothetical protein
MVIEKLLPFCPRCGFHARVDEDGRCLACDCQTYQDPKLFRCLQTEDSDCDRLQAEVTELHDGNEAAHGVLSRAGVPESLTGGPRATLENRIAWAAGRIEGLTEEVDRLRTFVAEYDAWAQSWELCSGPLFDTMLAARDALEES